MRYYKSNCRWVFFISNKYLYRCTP